MSLQQGLNRIGQSMAINYRQLFFNNNRIIPNPRIKDMPNLQRRYRDQIGGNEVIPYLETHIPKQSLLDANINIFDALQINSKWKMIDETLDKEYELRLLLEPIIHAHRYIFGFVNVGLYSALNIVSPYEGRQNLTLTYRDSNDAEQTMICWVKPSTKPKMINEVIPDNSIYFEGRIVRSTNQIYAPQDYPYTRRVSAVLFDDVSGLRVNGEFISDPFVPPQYAAIDRLQGSEICGFFYTVGSGFS